MGCVCVCDRDLLPKKQNSCSTDFKKMRVGEGNEITQKKTAKIISLNEKGVFEMEYPSLEG